jgi:dTDP-4-amino-4,6-dideoxygalactose transaminase
VSELVADTLVRLPLYTDISDADIDRVLAAVTGFTP